MDKNSFIKLFLFFSFLTPGILISENFKVLKKNYDTRKSI